MAFDQDYFFAPVRTNFIRYDEGYSTDLLTYSYNNDDHDFDFLGYRILLWCYLFYKKTYDYYVYTSIKELLNVCGLKGTTRNKSSTTFVDIKKCIAWFVDNKYIKPLERDSLDEYKINELIEFELDSMYFMPSVKGREGKDRINEPFVKITREEFDTLISINSSRKIPNQRLMAVFTYIKSLCRSKHRYGENKFNIEEYPNCWRITQDEIAEHFNCKQPRISEYTKQLYDAELLKRVPCNRTSEKNPSYIYTPHTENWKEEIMSWKRKYEL